MDHLEGPVLPLSGGVGSYKDILGFPGDLDGKESARSVRDPGSIPGLGRLPGEGNRNPFRYSGLGNPMKEPRELQSMGWSCKEAEVPED